MKRLLTIALALIPLLMTAQDDLYFTPSKKSKALQEERRAVTVRQQQPVVDYGVSTRSDDDYNRRYTLSGDYQNAGGLYADDTTLTARIDTVLTDIDIEDPEVDYRFSRRLVRFHSPRYYSPYYWDLMYGYGAWDYLYDPWDPWYWHYGWTYGWNWGPWDCWYGGIWGWGHMHHWSYWGWGPMWGWTPGHISVGIHNYRPRGNYLTSRGTGISAARGTGIRQRSNPASLGRGNVADVRSSGLRGSSLSARGNNGSNGRTSARSVGANSTTRNYTSGRTGNTTDYTGGRTSANRYNQRSTTTSRNTTTSRSYNNSTSSSRSSSSSYNSTPSRSSSSSSSRSSSSSSRSSSSYSSGSSSFGGGARSGGGSFGGGGGRSGGGGGGRR